MGMIILVGNASLIQSRRPSFGCVWMRSDTRHKGKTKLIVIIIFFFHNGRNISQSLSILDLRDLEFYFLELARRNWSVKFIFLLLGIYEQSEMFCLSWTYEEYSCKITFRLLLDSWMRKEEMCFVPLNTLHIFFGRDILWYDAYNYLAAIRIRFYT